MDQIISLFRTAEHNMSPAICVDIIQRALSQPGLYTFGEILELVSNKIMQEPQLQADQHVQSWLATMNTFIYGDWKTYQTQKASGTAAIAQELNAAQTKKLKQLTLVSIASTRQIVEFSHLSQELEIPESELEGFLSEATYDGIINGRLNMQTQQMEVFDSIGRDPSEERMRQIEQNLDKWLEHISSIQVDMDQYAKQSKLLAYQRHRDLEQVKAGFSS